MIEPVIIGSGRVVAYNADCRDVLCLMKERGERVHAMHSDPPYHLTSIVKRFGKEGAVPAVHGTDGAFARASRGFMGKEWDGGDIAFDPETWRLHLDALLPGGYLTAFASSRGFGRMSVAIEDAGFITHPMLGWIFGSGMPKATRLKADGTDHLRYGGQALKPALEPIYMGQKPMEGTGTANWLQHGVGPLDIDAGRIATEDSTGRHTNHSMRGGRYEAHQPSERIECGGSDLGRWPANVVHDGSPEVLEAFEAFGEDQSRNGGHTSGKRAMDGWGLGEAQTPTYRDAGSAARFFYEAKAAEDDRWFWCPVCETAGPARSMGAHQHGRWTESNDTKSPDFTHLVGHPTVKPLALARWLVRLTCPQRGQTVFDGFGGTGTTGVACLAEGRRAILCERDPDYFRILVARCQRYAGESAFALPGKVAKGREPVALPLFGSAAE